MSKSRFSFINTQGMTMRALCALSLLLLAGCASTIPEGHVVDGYPKFIAGTYAPGHNITEPRPHESKYLKTEEAGVVVMENGAGFYLRARRLKRPAKPLYIRVEYENPLEVSAPLANDMVLTAEATHAVFSSPEFIWGLRNYADYWIRIFVYDNKAHQGEPLDVLIQKVRSYVDTRTKEILVFHRLKTDGQKEVR